MPTVKSKSANELAQGLTWQQWIWTQVFSVEILVLY